MSRDHGSRHDAPAARRSGVHRPRRRRSNCAPSGSRRSRSSGLAMASRWPGARPHPGPRPCHERESAPGRRRRRTAEGRRRGEQRPSPSCPRVAGVGDRVTMARSAIGLAGHGLNDLWQHRSHVRRERADEWPARRRRARRPGRRCRIVASIAAGIGRRLTKRRSRRRLAEGVGVRGGPLLEGARRRGRGPRPRPAGPATRRASRRRRSRRTRRRTRPASRRVICARASSSDSASRRRSRPSAAPRMRTRSAGRSASGPLRT